MALGILDFSFGILGGSSGIGDGRWYLVEARSPYDGKLGFKCKSRVGFQVDESQVYNKSPEFQEVQPHSYMDLSYGMSCKSPDLKIEKVFLPALCAIKDAYPEITVTPGREISIQIRKTTRWEIPEAIVDDVYSRLMREAHGLKLALAQIESSWALAGISR